MKNLERRVDQLEAVTELERRVRHRHSHQRSDAFGRLRRSLHIALPETHVEYFPTPSGVMTWRGKETTHAELLPPLLARIDAGNPTGADLAVLASLPAEDLSIYGVSDVEFLRVVCKLATDY